MIKRVGLVGLGYIAPFHAGAARAHVPGVEVLGVDLAPDIARSMALDGMLDGAVDDLDSLIAAQVDVVHVLTPPNAHAATIDRLIDARVPVLVEKPLCDDPAEARRLTERAVAAGVALGVSHNQLFYATWERARELIHSGELGAVRSVDVNARRPLPPLRSLDVRPWMLHRAENILFEVAPHALAQALDVVDEIEVDSVQLHSWQDLPNGVRFARRWDVLAHGPDEVVVRLSLSYEDAAPENSIAVQGTLGSVVVDFDLDTATVRRRSHASFDVELLNQSMSAASAAIVGGVRRAVSVVGGKARVGNLHDPFTASIHRSVGALYDAIGGQVDRRHAGVFATAVVTLGRAIGDAAAPQIAAAGQPPAAPADETPAAETVTTTHPATASSAAPTDILVVGGTAFIGEPFVRDAARSNHVRVIARDPARIAEMFADIPVEVVPGDLRDVDGILEHVRPGTVVCQLFAGRGSTWEELDRTHVTPTTRLAEGCRDKGAARFVYVSSIAIYDAGDPDEVITEDAPISEGMVRVVPYARSKADVERRLMEMHQESGFPAVIARPGVVLGRGGDPCHWGVAEWQHSNVCTHWGVGTNPLPLVLVDDVASALTAMCTVPGIDGRSYNLAVDTDITAEDYVAELQRASGRPIRVRRRSNRSRFVGQIAKWAVKRLRDPEQPFPSKANSVGRSFASRFDATRAREDLGWSPVEQRAELLERGVAEPAREWSR